VIVARFEEMPTPARRPGVRASVKAIGVGEASLGWETPPNKNAHVDAFSIAGRAGATAPSFTATPLAPQAIICSASRAIRSAAFSELTPRAWILEIKFLLES
jgi:hypothetical protein